MVVSPRDARAIPRAGSELAHLAGLRAGRPGCGGLGRGVGFVYCVACALLCGFCGASFVLGMCGRVPVDYHHYFVGSFYTLS